MCEGVLGQGCPVRLEGCAERNLWHSHSGAGECHISTKETSIKVAAGQEKSWIKSYSYTNQSQIPVPSGKS